MVLWVLLGTLRSVKYSKVLQGLCGDVRYCELLRDLGGTVMPKIL